MPAAATLYADALELLGQLGLVLLGLVGAFVLFLLLLHFLSGERTSRRVRAQQRARDEAWKRRDEEAQRKRVERELQCARELRADPKWPDAVLDHYLRWLHGSPTDEWTVRAFQGLQLREAEVGEARERARREGLAVHDGRRWRLTSRGRRIFEEYAGDRKRMNEAEKKRNQPSIRIDARGAGTVAHTIEGGVHGTTVNNAAPSSPTAKELDLPAVLQLMEQLRAALSEADGLSDLTRRRAAGDLGEVDRELRAPEDERDPSRVRGALERLRTSFVGVDGLVQVVNQLSDHLRVWFHS
ncbi:hypothetical protein [Streptomyces cyanogenus]|uniref:Uncharacterized protein n=1 Tax=Streptomyces cyanogenus TaxID=80860 RepID=A0ABX7TU20_STRCY|nr:hypothetical protein [Streptomyces cyanogenus]QTD99353.1 hypothetical protein S1361_18525 [Streptomyces cyanogenus]